jgi:hypothetical protein
MSPGLASGAQEIMLITVNNCDSQPASTAITAIDSLNHTYNFNLVIPKQ